MFSEAETQYLKSQPLARIATVSSKGQPDVVPVGFEFDGKYFWVGSHSQDIFHLDPWKPRAIKVYGTADVLDHQGRFGQGKYLRVTPKISWSFGIAGLKSEGPGWGRVKTVHH